MSKSERLLELLTLLRSKRYAVTAKCLSEALDVSERTIYRDIQSLLLSGVPIQGEAGVGYLLDSKSHIPPLMFTEEEILAIELGMRMVRAWSDKSLADASESASRKIHSVIPDSLKQKIERFPMVVPDFFIESDVAQKGEVLRHAINQRQSVSLRYVTGEGKASTRVVQPLGQVYWGKVWTLVAWCELRGDYRSFRVDRISQLDVLDTLFELSPTKSLEHYINVVVKGECG